MTADTTLPSDANEADVIEQRQPIADDDEMEMPDELPLDDADAADALDQRRTVPLDDDGWPASPAD